MRFPSKVTPCGESILPLSGAILERIPTKGMSVLDLFQFAKKQRMSTGEFFQMLDFLFAIGTITLNQNKEVCHVG